MVVILERDGAKLPQNDGERDFLGALVAAAVDGVGADMKMSTRKSASVKSTLAALFTSNPSQKPPRVFRNDKAAWDALCARARAAQKKILREAGVHELADEVGIIRLRTQLRTHAAASFRVAS